MSRHVSRVGHYLIEAGILEEDNNHYDSLIPTKFVPSEYTRVKKSGHNLLLTFAHNIHAALKKLCLSCIEGCSWIHHKTRYRLDHAINTRKERLSVSTKNYFCLHQLRHRLSLSLSLFPTPSLLWKQIYVTCFSFAVSREQQRFPILCTYLRVRSTKA